jgi:hypothetical protein
VISTSYPLAGVSTGTDVRRVVDEISTVSGVGAVAVELGAQGAATMILKHKPDVELDRVALGAALQKAGGYSLGT